MTIEDLAKKFVALASIPTLSKAQYEEARKLMRNTGKPLVVTKIQFAPSKDAAFSSTKVAKMAIIHYPTVANLG